MKGHIRARGKRSWELKFDAARDEQGKRRIQYHAFRGSKREAQVKLAELIASVGQGEYVEPSKATVADFVRARIDQWEAAGNISARTAQRYRELLKNQIEPHLGTKPLQQLKPLHIETWHTMLRNRGKTRGDGRCAPRTIGHAHRVLSKALSDALKNNLVISNVCKTERAPRPPDDDMVIVQDIPSTIAKLRNWRLGTVAMISLLTGCRLGEVLALRWSRVHVDRKVIEVREALEQTKTHGIRVKSPKSKAGRRDITLPDILVDALRHHRRKQLELRMQLGAGRLPDDALLFSGLDNNPLSPNAVSAAWHDFAESAGMAEISFHALRHSHASQLIDAGVDIVTISTRLGHAKPDITLRIYAHLFRKDDGKAAAAINLALAGIS
jgi:integrase